MVDRLGLPQLWQAFSTSSPGFDLSYDSGIGNQTGRDFPSYETDLLEGFEVLSWESHAEEIREVTS
jgi:hypothetical protein